MDRILPDYSVQSVRELGSFAPVGIQHKLRIAVIALLLLATAAGWWRTRPPATIVPKGPVSLAISVDVDASSYDTAQRLARLASTPEEQTYAASAVRISDHALALAFSTALREVEAHPPVLGPEALQIQDRLRKSQALLDGDQQRVVQLTAALASAKPSQRDSAQDELDLAQSQLDLDKDEVEEANQDLVAAGGNPQERIETLLQEHNAEVKARTAEALPTAQSSADVGGSWHKVRAWLQLHQKSRLLSDAAEHSLQRAAALSAQRVALAETLEQTKGGIAELAQHTKSAKTSAPPPAAPSAAPGPQHSHEDAAALLSQTKAIAADQKILPLLDRRAADHRELAAVYRQWASVVSAQAGALAHKLLSDAVIVMAVLVALLFLDAWLERLLKRPKLDRRQVETLRSLARTGLRVLAVIIILLILIGLPTQFGTMIGIVGAGLTVALKDFIVAFFGWLALMGRNGIRLGDWVEINGVSGEVTELGMFHTVLLETGNWSDAGHPTGRRVTFTNSFAIEGHYFNFSTSGQWLWDELKVVVPSGQDPYPIVDAITKQVTQATAESARLAEQEWQRAVPTQRDKSFSGAPGVNIKPVIGGVEITVRYITRANDRYALRAKLYQSTVDLLGQKAAPAAL